jgi:hypothetical protein
VSAFRTVPEHNGLRSELLTQWRIWAQTVQEAGPGIGSRDSISVRSGVQLNVNSELASGQGSVADVANH